MEQKTIRLFVGNLPPDTSEDDVKHIMKKYASVVSVEIKNRTDAVFAFVNLTADLKADLSTCLNKLSLKTWKGHQLRVQIAKESFLERLARERMNNQKNSIENANISAITEKTIDPSDDQLGSGIQIDNTINGSILKENYGSSIVSSDSEDSTYDSETSRKGVLPMFSGTKSVFQNGRHSFSKLNSSKISTNRIHEEKEILGKFEMYNSVWKDESTNKEGNPPKCDLEMKEKTNKKDYSFPVDLNINEKVTVVPTQTAESLIAISLSKQDEAEKRRKKALEDKQKELLKRKHAVKFALASVDNLNCTNRPNKKIFFSDDEPPSEGNENWSQRKEGKLTLFSDDEMECETSENDFRIRNHYEGIKGQSLLALQAKYGNDKRFILDERFIENDEQEEESKTNEDDDAQEERQKVLKILGTVLGKEVHDLGKTKSKNATKLMLRYDPSKPGHEKFEIKQESNLQKSKKKKGNEQPADVLPVQEPTDVLPVVSKERYYQVSENLLEIFQNRDQKFSLLEMFGEENENEGVDADFDTKLINKKDEWFLNPFKDEFGALGDEMCEQNINIDNDSTQNNVGVKQENLFFSLNDARFIEGLEFINKSNEEYINNFHEIRKGMKRIVKHKTVRNIQKTEKWKTKLGGRRKNAPSKKTTKKNL